MAVSTSTITLDHRGDTIRGWQLGEVTAAAPAVLLVHGFGSTDTGGQQLLVQTARAIAGRGGAARSYSRLGQGTSDGEFADITITDEVDQVVSMIRALSADADGPVHVVAHSLGAVESAMAAARVPQLVATLTLWSPAGVVVDDIAEHDEIQGQSLAPVRDQGFFDFGGLALGTAFIDEVRDGLDVYETVGGYTGSAEVVHGTADQIVPLDYGRRYADLLPGAEFVPVEGADHGWSSVAFRRLLLDRLLPFVGLDRGAGSATTDDR